MFAKHLRTTESYSLERLFICLSFAWAWLPTDADYLSLGGLRNIGQDVHHKWINMGLVFSHIFSFSKNVVIIKNKAFLTILFGYYFEGINYDKTVPHQSVDFTLE
jgi:hypothetical protein